MRTRGDKREAGVGAYSGRNQASVNHAELFLVMLKTEIDIVDFAPATASEN
jgi:hypothetical protein